MPIRLLTPIDTPDSRLDRVFNSYLYHLTSLEKVIAPRLSMAARTALVDDDAAHETDYSSEVADMFFHLATLTNSLHQLADCLMVAYQELEIFVSEGADLEWYARYKQRDAIHQAGRARRKPSNWQAQYQSLAPFELHAVLAPCFAGYPGIGERIGTSRAVDFAYHSGLLLNELTFSLRDPGQPGITSNFTTYRPDEAVGLPVEQPDERWEGYSISLAGPEAVAEFEAVLVQGQQAADLYHSVDVRDAAGYRQLHELLTQLIDG